MRLKNQLDGDRIVEGRADDLIAMVVEAEMSFSLQPEALKAQAVAAYTYFIYKNAHNGEAPAAPMKPASAKSVAAVQAVSGQWILHNGKVINSVYSAMSAGKTANGHEVWEGGTYYPYLLSVDDPVSGVKDFNSTRTYSAENARKWVWDAYKVDLSDVTDKNKWFVPEYDANRLYAKTVSLGGKKTVVGLRLRDTVFTEARGVGRGNTLRSHAYNIAYNPDKDEFTFSCKGYGHGVGMSQYGADEYAKQGWNYLQILAHYYQGTGVG